MADHPATLAVLGAAWGIENDESAFVMRALAAALSRIGTVQVLVPGAATPGRPDGAFDLVAVGGVASAGSGTAAWPEPAAASWPKVGSVALAVAEGGDAGAGPLLEAYLPDVPIVRVKASGGDRRSRGAAGPWLSVEHGSATESEVAVGLHVPAHRLAAARRHVGIGFDDYVLVLGDRGPGALDDDTPTPMAAWLAAGFADRHVIVVEDALATVWRARSLRGVITVDTRTDLWRLIAHARLTVDLSPGPLIARECVESLLYGVPVVVPAGSCGARLAALGGGLWFRDEAELLGCVEAFDDQQVRDTLGEQGRSLAAAWYGDAGGFVERVAGALSGLGVLG